MHFKTCANNTTRPNKEITANRSSNQLAKIKIDVLKICELSSQIKEHSGSTFPISQSYLKKSEAITNLLASMGGLKDLISQSELLHAIRRRIKQQNDSVNKYFARNPDELLNFFCEKNTDITWSDVDDTLIM